MDNQDERTPEVGEQETLSADPKPEPKAKPQVDLSALKSSDAGEWQSGGRKGCGLWIFVVIFALVAGLLAAGYVSLKQSVWFGLKKRSEHLVERVSIEISSGERDALATRLEEFNEALKQRDNPYPAMGEFSNIATAALADGRVSRRELMQLDEFFDRELDGADAAR